MRREAADVRGRSRRRASVALLLALVALALSAVAAYGVPMQGGFDPTGTLADGGHKVHVSGKTPACARGRRILLGVEVFQGRHHAPGRWPAHACNGHRLDWKLTATIAGAALHKSKATGVAFAAIKRPGHDVRVEGWSAKITLR